MSDDLRVLQVNTGGRAPHISRRRLEEQRSRALRQAERRRNQKKADKKAWTSQEPSAFPLSPLKNYDLTTKLTLVQFPKSSVKAVQHFAKTIAPPQEGEWRFFDLTPDQVKLLANAFNENIRARWAFRKLLAIYRISKAKAKVINTEDPITLEPFRNPIRLYYNSPNIAYEFEAKSLVKHWSSNLSEHDGFFIQPRFPTNPLTNLPLNCVQLHSALKLIRQLGVGTDWIIESFSSCKYSEDLWKKRFYTPLMSKCIDRVFSDIESYDRLETLMDFVEMQYEFYEASFPKNLFRWLFVLNAENDYAFEWIKQCKKFYKEKYTLNTKDELEFVEFLTHTECEKLIFIPQTVKVMYKQYVGKLRQNVESSSSSAVRQSEGTSSVSTERN